MVPSIGSRQRQSTASFLSTFGHAGLVCGQDRGRHRWPTFVPARSPPYGPTSPDVQRLIASTAGDFARDSHDRNFDTLGRLRLAQQRSDWFTLGRCELGHRDGFD